MLSSGDIFEHEHDRCLVSVAPLCDCLSVAGKLATYRARAPTRDSDHNTGITDCTCDGTCVLLGDSATTSYPLIRNEEREAYIIQPEINIESIKMGISRKFPSSLLMFSCFSSPQNIYLTFSIQQKSEGLFQVFIGNPFFLASIKKLLFISFEISSNHRLFYRIALCPAISSVYSLRHYATSFLNRPLLMSISEFRLKNEECFVCQYNEKGRIPFDHVLLNEHPIFLNYIYQVISRSLFDHNKFFSPKSHLIFLETFTVSQNFIIPRVKYSIKNVGFHLYSKKSVVSKKPDDIRKSLPDKVSQCRQILPKIIEMNDNKERKSDLIPNGNGAKITQKSLSRCSFKLMQNNIRLHYNDIDSSCETHSKSLDNKSCSTAGLRPNTDRKSTKTVFTSNNQSIFTKPKIEKDSFKHLLANIQSKYLQTNHLGGSRLSRVKEMSKKKSRNETVNNKPEISTFMMNVIICEEVMSATNQQLHKTSDKLARKIIYDVWYTKSFLSRREGRHFSSLRTDNQTSSPSKNQMKIQSNLTTFVLNRRSKLYNSQTYLFPYKLNKKPGEKYPYLDKRPTRLKPDKFFGSKICDLIASETILGQLPRSCLKSKCSNGDVKKEPRNLSWNLKKTNLRKQSPSNSRHDTNNNRCVKSEIEERPTSIFDFAKMRCASADFCSKIILTNEELIKALKRPFSQTEVQKTVTSVFPWRQKSRTNSLVDNQSSQLNNFRCERRFTRSQNRGKSAISSIVDCKHFNKEENSLPRRVLMNRFKTENKWNCVLFQRQKLNFQNLDLGRQRKIWL